jgi:hypothetical protein
MPVEACEDFRIHSPAVSGGLFLWAANDSAKGAQWRLNALRSRVASLLRKAPDGIRLSEHLIVTDGNTLFRHACAMGLEGLVAKRRDRPYRSGRSKDWIKVKNPDAPGGRTTIP